MPQISCCSARFHVVHHRSGSLIGGRTVSGGHLHSLGGQSPMGTGGIVQLLPRGGGMDGRRRRWRRTEHIVQRPHVGGGGHEFAVSLIRTHSAVICVALCVGREQGLPLMRSRPIIVHIRTGGTAGVARFFGPLPLQLTRCGWRPHDVFLIGAKAGLAASVSVSCCCCRWRWGEHADQTCRSGRYMRRLV